MMRLSQIHCFPLKSAAGISQPTAQIAARGLAGDRRWMVVSPAGDFITGRTVPAMVRLRAALTVDGLVLSMDGEQVAVPLPDVGGTRLSVEVWGDRVEALEATGGAWLSARLGRDCRLVYMDDSVRRPVDADYALGDDITSFADGFPLLLISEGSLEDLNGRLDRPVTMGHFRPNLVVSGCPPFAEDDWRTIRNGSARLALVKRCSRCVFTTVDPLTGQRSGDGEPLKTLAGYRKSEGGVMFGQNLLVTTPGSIAVGDTVVVES